MGYNYSHPKHIEARAGALARSGGVCQFCGQRPAVEGHHWAEHYPQEEDMTVNDLTALCGPCHSLATSLRRYSRWGGNIWTFKTIFRKVIDQCFTPSVSRAFLPSFNIPQADLTLYSPSTSRKPKLPRSGEPTGPTPMMPDSGNSKPLPAFGLTSTANLPSRHRPSAASLRPGQEK